VSDAVAPAASTAPRPRPTLDSAPYWESLRERALRVQVCAGCGAPRLYPSPICRRCHSFAARWEPVSGRGTLRSYCVTHRIGHPAFAAAVPYVTADVLLEEGVGLSGRLLDAAAEQVRPGMAVRLDYLAVDEQLVLPAFRPA
jgi:hypothetical protein